METRADDKDEVRDRKRDGGESRMRMMGERITLEGECV